MIIMHYQSLQPRVSLVSGKKTEESIFSKPKMNLKKMIARDELIEYARYVENYYGTPKTVCYGAVRSRQGCDP